MGIDRVQVGKEVRKMFDRVLPEDKNIVYVSQEDPRRVGSGIER